jgi:cell division protein FtsB
LKRENEAIIEGYQSEIEKLEAEQEGLRFNNDLLDQGNRDLEI